MVSPFTITLGIGQYYENIRDISKSYSEARVAINLGYSLQWFDRILFYNRLGLYRLLAPVMNSPESEELCIQYIQPLEDYDRRYHGELLAHPAGNPAEWLESERIRCRTLYSL